MVNLGWMSSHMGPPMTTVRGCWSPPISTFREPGALLAGAALQREGEVAWSLVSSLMLEKMWEDLGQENCSHSFLKTSMKCFSKASLQATMISRAILAFSFCGLLLLLMDVGQGSPAPAAIEGWLGNWFTAPADKEFHSLRH